MLSQIVCHQNRLNTTQEGEIVISFIRNRSEKRAPLYTLGRSGSDHIKSRHGQKNRTPKGRKRKVIRAAQKHQQDLFSLGECK